MYQGYPYKKYIQIEKDKQCTFHKNLGVERLSNYDSQSRCNIENFPNSIILEKAKL